MVKGGRQRRSAVWRTHRDVSPHLCHPDTALRLISEPAGKADANRSAWRE